MATQIMYHGTAKSQADSIVKQGLIPGKGKGGDAWALALYHHDPRKDIERKPSVFLTPYRAEARRFASVATEVNHDSAGVVLAVSVDPTKLVEDELDTEGYRYEGRIPASRVKVLEVIPHPKPLRLDDSIISIPNEVTA